MRPIAVPGLRFGGPERPPSIYQTVSLGSGVNSLRNCFTFIAVRYTAGNKTIGKGGRGPAADSEVGKL